MNSLVHQEEAKNKGLKILKSGLLVFSLVYLFSSYFWLGRQTTILTDEPLQALRQFWFFFGLEQDWRLFAPKVRNFNCYPSAVINLSGARVLWQGPGPDLQSDPLRRNLHRKFCVDCLPWQICSGYWSQFCHYAKDSCQADGVEVKSVSLIQNEDKLENPQIKFRKQKDLPAYYQYLIHAEYFANSSEGAHK